MVISVLAQMQDPKLYVFQLSVALIVQCFEIENIEVFTTQTTSQMEPVLTMM